MNRRFNPVVTIVVAALVVIILYFASSWKMFDTFVAYFKTSLGILIGLVLLGVVAVVGSIWVRSWSHANTTKKRPNFFEEMQSVIRATLLPLGFEEKEGSGRSRFAEYSKDEFSVCLTLDIMDSIYYVTASRNSKVADDQRKPKPDFTVECDNLGKADEFKSESIAKLKEWLIEKRVR